MYVDIVAMVKNIYTNWLICCIQVYILLLHILLVRLGSSRVNTLKQY